MTLLINCCPRDESRTRALTQKLLDKLGAYKEIDLYRESLQPLDKERLNYRTALIEKGDYSDPIFDYAKEFAAADIIVIAAPFWDLSFPSLLKVYLENIYVTGLVSKYSDEGIPIGLCKAEKLYYVTTAGGPFDGRFSYDYIKALAENCFGIASVVLIKAEMLDVWGSDPEQLVKAAADGITVD